MGSSRQLPVYADRIPATASYRPCPDDAEIATFRHETLPAFRLKPVLGGRPGQAGALDYVGAVRRMTGEYPAAAQALEIFQRIGTAEAADLHAELEALTGPPPAW
jgi:hypothetical protein